MMMTMRVWLFLSLAFLMALSLMAMPRFNALAESTTIFVPTDFSTIQDAINNATDGDTVFVYNGTYVGNVIVDKAVSLVGENKSITTINGGGVDAVVRVTADNVSITGFTVESGSYTEIGASILLSRVRNVNLTDNIIASSYAGIRLVNSSLNRILGNGVSNCNMSVCLNSSGNNILQSNLLADSTLAGIYLNLSSGNRIERNMLSNTGTHGIHFQRSSDNKMLSNGIVGCENGVLLEDSGGNTLVNNTIGANRYNFGASGSTLSDFSQDIDTSNKVNGKSIYYLVNKNNFSINASTAQGIGYLAVVNCSNFRANGLNLDRNNEGFLSAYSPDCLIENSTVSNNKRAAFVYSCSRCNIINSTFLDNEEGISLTSSAKSSVKNSSIARGGGDGLKLVSSGNSVVEGNAIENNAGRGINIYSSPNCNVSRNTIVTNGFGVFAQVSANSSVIGNVVTGNTGDGVYFSYSDNCLAQDNNVSGNHGYGIVFQTAQFGSTINNFVANNNQSGISLYMSSYGRVASNVAKYNEAGISLQTSPNGTVYGNEAYANSRGGIYLADSPRSNVSFNTVFNSGWEGLTVLNSANSTLDANVVYGGGKYGIWLQNSSGVDILDSNVSSNAWDGIYLRDSNQDRVLNNSMNTNGNAGCRLYSCELVTYMQNNVTRNTDGLQIFLSNNNNVDDNNIVQNSAYGLNIFNSIGNKIYHNNFVNNTNQATVYNSSLRNFWDDGYPSGGNYWSDYVGVDVKSGPNQDQLGSDGIGDLPYTVSSGDKDRYPIMMVNRLHDLTLERVVLPSNQIYVGWVFDVNVTTKNNGGYIESFNVTVYYNDTVIEARTVSNLTVGESFTMSLMWNTSSLQSGRIYDVKARVTVVQGETHIQDNVYDFGAVKVKMIGDVNGDSKVNILDIAAIATRFGCKAGEPRYELNCDMNLDYVINIIDISMAAKNFGRIGP